MRVWPLAFCAAATLAASASALTQSKLAQFKIKVIPSATGVHLECEVGCAWAHVEWTCNEGVPSCSGVIDQMGMADPR